MQKANKKQAVRLVSVSILGERDLNEQMNLSCYQVWWQLAIFTWK